MKINHIGYWVDCIEKSIETFKMLGYEQKTGVFYDGTRECYICFLDNSDFRLKLIQPAGPESVIYNLLNEHEEQNYHICYETTAFECDVLNLQNDGFEVFPNQHINDDFSKEYAIFLSSNKDGFIELFKAS